MVSQCIYLFTLSFVCCIIGLTAQKKQIHVTQADLQYKLRFKKKSSSYFKRMRIITGKTYSICKLDKKIIIIIFTCVELFWCSPIALILNREKLKYSVAHLNTSSVI